MDTNTEAKKRRSYAVGYFELGMYREAFSEIRRYAQLARLDRDTALLALECCKRVEDWGQLADFAEYIGRRYAETMPEALIYQSKAELKRGNVGIALSLLDEGIRKRPDCCRLWYEMARTFSLLQCYGLVGRAMMKVVMLDPSMAETVLEDPDFSDYVEGDF